MLLEFEQPLKTKPSKSSSYALDTKNKLKNKKYLLQLLPSQLESISDIKYVHVKTTIYSRKAKKKEQREVRLKTAYIIDLVSNLMFKYYYEQKIMVRLSAEVLREKYGTNYNHYLTWLDQRGILTLAYNYSQQHGKCKTFKLSKKLFTENCTRYKNYDNVLLKRYKSKVSDDECIIESNIDERVREKLVNDLFYVSIDKEAAYNTINFFSKNDLDVYNSNRYAIDCISERHIHYNFDKYGRFHTNFTRLKSIIRTTHLKIDGEEICEVDISNSQPLFLTKIIDSHELNYSIDTFEYETFKNLTNDGLLYKHLMDKLLIKDKKEAKSLIYNVFFGKNNQRYSHDVLFKKVFPTIYGFIRAYKKVTNDYCTLAHELQRAESQFIFNEVIREIIDTYPDIKLFTVHDSIIFPKKWKTEVESIFNRRLEETFGKV